MYFPSGNDQINALFTCVDQHMIWYMQERVTPPGITSSALCDQCVGTITRPSCRSFETSVVRLDLRFVGSPYPRRLESLTVCRRHYKGSTFTSVIKDPDYWTGWGLNPPPPAGSPVFYQLIKQVLVSFSNESALYSCDIAVRSLIK